MSMWISGATMLIGAGTSIYGADKQRKLTNQANDANRQQYEDTKAENYRRYLMTRGIGDNGAPINSKLPLWAVVGKTLGGGYKVMPSLATGFSTTPALAGGAAPAGNTRSWAGLGVR